MQVKNIYKLAIFLLGTSLQTHANPLDIPESNVFVPKRLATSARLTYSNHDFYLSIKDKEYQIKKHDIRDLPATITADQLQQFLKVGYFSIGKVGEDYSLQANFRLRGGVRLGNQIQGNKDKGDMTTAGGILGGSIGAGAGAGIGYGLGYGAGLLIGGPGGGQIGGTIGSILSTAFGSGGYALGNNSSSPTPQAPAPKNVGNGNGGGGGNGW